MPFYPPRRGVGPMPRQRFGVPSEGPFRRPNNFNNYPNQYQYNNYPDQYQYNNFRQEQPMFNPYQQSQNNGFGGLPDHINTVMGHMGTFTNGINMMRQVGALMSLFR